MHGNTSKSLVHNSPFRMLLAAFYALIGACGGSSPMTERAPSEVPGCDMRSLPSEISKALIAQDANAFQEALYDMSDQQRAEATVVLSTYWDCEYSRPKSRTPEGVLIELAIADRLSQATRNQQIDRQLDDFRKSALRNLLASDSLTQKVAAIRLSGISDATEAISFLEQTVRGDHPSGIKSEAIRALGHMCSSDAERVLDSLEQHHGIGTDLSQVLHEVRERRKFMATSWCLEHEDSSGNTHGNTTG